MTDGGGIGQSRWVNLFADVIITIVVCLLTVNKLSPDFMNADVMMNSIMSLQNVTLFYWGQDRLLNVLPFVLSAVQNPRLNFYLCIILSNLCFCALVWAWARGLSSSFARVENRAIFRRLIFLVTYLIFVLVLKPLPLFEIAVWHIEYTLSYALFVWIVFDLILKPAFAPLDYARMIAFIVLGTGINNSIVLPACFAFCGFVWVRRRVSPQLIVLLVGSLLSFKLWAMIAHRYPHSPVPYSDFYVKNIEEFAHTTATNFLAALKVPALCVLTMLACGLKLLQFNLPERFKTERIGNWEEILGLFTLFGFGWFLMFSVNSWVWTNHFHFRYFAPIIFLYVAVLSIKFSEYLLLLRPYIQSGLGVVVLVALTAFLAAKFKPLEQYAAFERVEKSVGTGADGYAGDYWRVWPAVLRDLINGKPAVGFAELASGNQQAVVNQFSPQARPGGDLNVVCFAPTPAPCVSWVQSLLPDYKLDGTTPIDAETSSLRLMRASP